MKKSTLFFSILLSLSILFIAMSVYIVFNNNEVDLTSVRRHVNSTKKKIAEVKADKTPQVTEANQAVTRVFSAMVTYNSQQSYDSRRDNVRDLLTNEVYDSDKAFSPDPNQKVASLNLKSNFKNAELFPNNVADSNLTGKVLVTFESGYDNRNKGTSYVVYDVDYDTEINKFTSISYEGSYNLGVNSDLLK